MANRIKGITIEIAGDTTKLTDALRDVNGEIKSTQAQLKDVEKLLKLDPCNTELLSQKQSLLNDAISETKNKLLVLQHAADSANDALSKGSITQSQYDALQREIIETANALEKLESQAEESIVSLQKISKTGDDFKALGGKIESAGSALLPLSTAITGVSVAGIKVASDFEKGMSQVKAITNATEEEFQTLRDVAIDLGASTAFSATEVSDAMTEMAKAGWTTTQIIDGMAGVLDATAASGENLGTVSTIVADAITGFGLSAKDSAVVADLLTQAANSGTISITDLGETYKYVAPLAKSMDLTIQDVTTAISAMSMAGIKGSQAGTSLRTVLANLAKPTGSVKKAMKDLNLSVSNTDGSFKSLDTIITELRYSFDHLSEEQKAYYATSLAGKEGMSGLLSLLNLTQKEYDALSVSMKNCNGIAGETAEIMQDNLQSKTEQLGGALESLAIRLSDYVIPFLTKLVERLTALIDAFTGMNPLIQKAVLLFSGLFAILSPLLLLAGNMITAFGTILSIMPKLAPAITVAKTAFISLFTLMKANPIAILIAAIAALVLAIKHLWNTSEAFRSFWSSIKAFFIASNESLKSNFTHTWNAIRSVISISVNAIISAITTAMNLLVAKVSTAMSSVYSLIQTGFSKAVSYIKNLATDAYSWGRDMIMGIVQGIRNSISAVASAAKSVANTIRSYLHFSVPDVGPLTEYESWMPDFMQGLAKGIEDSKFLVEKAISHVASDMVVSPALSTDMAYSPTNRKTDNQVLLSGIKEITDKLTGTTQGMISIPIYLGNRLLDEVIVDVQSRANLRSGGR